MKLQKGIVWITIMAACMILCVRSNVMAAAEETEETEGDRVAVESPSVLLMESATGQVLFEKNADEQRSPASITKIMTLLLIFEELEKGTITLEEEAVASAHAKSMGGSQVFLEEGERQTVETLIKCIVVASGNDASVVMAEHIAGSEAAFVKRMNEKARKLGLENTSFQDCCGLSESKEHYTTARDVAVMSRELISRYPQVLSYSSIWMEDITHVTEKGTKKFGLTNTNKMIRSYEGCVGLKTGSTSVAKFCVSAVAQRDDITLVAVVMGAPDPKLRFRDAAAMLHYGFGVCSLYVDENREKLPKAAVTGSIAGEASCAYEGSFRYLDTKGMALDQVEKKIVWKKEVKAPVKKGDTAGEARYYLGEKEIGSVKILFAQDVPRASYSDYLKLAAERYLSGAKVKKAEKQAQAGKFPCLFCGESAETSLEKD